MSITYVPRVTQLDAIQLDEQVEELFKQQLFYAIRFLEPGILQPILPELELFLRTWIFKYSMYDKKLTFGQQMLSLKYNKTNFSNSKLYWYYIYNIVLKYIKERAIYSYTSNIQVQNFINHLDRFQTSADILNFIVFIQRGKYPVLIDFILGLELSADKLTRENLTDFSWTRELLWHNIIELIGTGVSLLSMFGLQHKLRNFLKYMWWQRPLQTSAVISKTVMTVHTACAVCSGKPVLPHYMGCSHIFCYYCLAANKLADQDFACPKCYYNGNFTKPFKVK